MLDAIGKDCKYPICSKSSHPLSAYNQRTHFEIGTDFWDDKPGRQRKDPSVLAYPDPKVVYMRYIPPDKNASVVELTQGAPDNPFLTENKDCFQGKMDKKREPFPVLPSQVHLGDDPREVETQYAFVHRKGQAEKKMPDTKTKWPKTPANHVIHGAIREDKDPRFNERHNLTSNNHSVIMNDNSAIRNPIFGVYNERPAHPGLTSQQYVQQENRTIPPLKSLGAVRHQTYMDYTGPGLRPKPERVKPTPDIRGNSKAVGKPTAS